MKEKNQTTEKKSLLEETEEIETPQGILNFLLRRNGTRFPYLTKNRYSVTDLVNCQRKSLYKQLGVEQEELLEDQSVEGMWATVRGDLLHKMTYAYKWREIDIEYNVPLNDGNEAKLIGRLDMYDWKTKTVIDLKSTKFVKWQIKRGFLPKLEHILQVQCYGTMFSKYIPIENLNIVYVDTSDIVTYKIKKRDLSTWIQTRIQEIEEAVNNKTIIKGEPSGLCQYCRYQSRCFNDGNGIEHTPLSAPKRSDKDGS
jgi:CRISPR/Cas system-associated exonuclease Cas4 (RecB family)